MKNAVYLSWRNYDPITDYGDIFLECPTCELIEEFSTMLAARSFERAHLNSPSHVKKFYFGEKHGHPSSQTLPQR
jgi:hypothetical protein